ncbi:MAG: hypothetical protein N0E44_21370, partial [Candidatus Thiodiazotropha lotti]|nr:hypothetical protein [Candidatus Thiodiazotropha lotti]MCW4222424.1 hypothetical protein [Candidatus Thiodiazotropha lotti]
FVIQFISGVTHVSEHVLPMSPVYTPIKGEGHLCITLADFEFNGKAVTGFASVRVQSNPRHEFNLDLFAD